MSTDVSSEGEKETSCGLEQTVDKGGRLSTNGKRRGIREFV